MNEAQILKAYEFAKERYAAIGVDTDKAIETLEKTPSPCTAGRPTT